MSNPPNSKRTKRSNTNNTIHQTNNNNSLAVIVLDVSPLAWGEHDVKRKALDRARQAAGKSSMGPAILEEVLQSVVALCNCIASLERSSALIILAVANNECATVFPRKNQLAHWMVGSYTPDTQQISELLISGVAELLARVVSNEPQHADARQAAMAAAFSTALCLLNRMMVVARAGGVSALQQPHYLERAEDEGVVAMMDPSSANNTSLNNSSSKSAWSPRILLIQASEDRARDYNAFMNCAFAAKKENITVDGCFLTATTNPKDATTSTSSRFLEQVCDLTGGVYSAPSGMAQVGGALTQVLLSVFFGARALSGSLEFASAQQGGLSGAVFFETGATVDQAHVCNLCLSIFRNRPSGPYCPTCQAKIVADPMRRQSI